MIFKMPLEQKIRLLSSDVLGTLVHLPSGSDATPLEGLVEVGSRRYVHKKTQQLLGKFHELGVTVVLVSGMKLSSYRSMLPHLPHSYAAIEDGSLLYKNGNRDEEWDQKLAVELVTLQRYKEDLKAKFHLIIDDLDRTASFRIDPRYNDRNDLQQLSNDFPELDLYPPQLRRTEHTPYPPSYLCYQFVPASSGKANALQFIMERLGLSWANVAAFGDDLNDMEMLEKAAFPMTLISTNQNAGAIQKLVVDRKGDVAQGYSHTGSILALSNLVEVVKSQQSDA